MRPLLIVALLAPLTAGCGDDASPVFADLFWQVRCQVAGGCEPDIMRHEIIATNGEAGHVVSCNLQDLGDTYSLSFNAFQGTEYGIGVRNAVFPKGGGGVTGTSCVVNAREKGNVYEGGCSAAPPSGNCVERPSGNPTWSCPSPCQVSVNLSDEMDGPTIRADLRCSGFGLEADPLRVVELNNPDDPAMPATVRFVNCPGS